MKRIIITTVWSIHCLMLSGQTSALEDTLSAYLKETKEITSANRDLWGIDLYAPILFVDAKTGAVYGNEPDVSGILRLHKQMYVGELPKSMNVANTAVNWSGKRWAMILLPLPENKNDRLNLIAHELFHQAQPALHFTLNNPDNNHLDSKDGRIYLRLELEALRKAIFANAKKTVQKYIADALTFRKARYQLFPKADTTENLLELNEGMAEYTGLALSDRTDKQMQQHLDRHLTKFLANKTFVRSFAYETIPMYGYLLSKKNRYWNKDISNDTKLTDYFQHSFGIKLPANIREKALSILAAYDGERIVSEETKREERNAQLIKSQIDKFVGKPHFEIPFEKMSASFDPTNIISLNEFGTVYPTITVTDNWGILTVHNGALMSPTWNRITITEPTEISPGVIKGDGWTLELNSDLYFIKKPDGSKNYYLTKK